MKHDRTLAKAAKTPQAAHEQAVAPLDPTRAKGQQGPASALSSGAGFAGLAGLIGWLLIAKHYGMDGLNSALASVFFCGLPMVLWSLLVDKVHRNPSTGIDWSLRRPWNESIDISMVKLAGLWATWGIIATFYAVGRWYWQGNYLFAMEFLMAVTPWMVGLSIPYVLWLDRRMVEPRDGAHAFGLWLIGKSAGDAQAKAEIKNHLLSWTIKGFFTAFMLSITPWNFIEIVQEPYAEMIANPVRMANWAIAFLFLIDVHFAMVGYVLTMKPLDAHIRSANPYLAGWLAAMMCYPPLLIFMDNYLEYEVATASWDQWLASYPALIIGWGALMVFLTGIYAWATMAFGIRFSNLTHRGVLTHGPYSFTRHPAYVSKNLFWWLSTLPFLVTNGSIGDAIRNTIGLTLISGIYYWRAKTEEKHLLNDPAYRAYWEHMEANGLMPRLWQKITGRSRPAITLDPLHPAP